MEIEIAVLQGCTPNYCGDSCAESEPGAHPQTLEVRCWLPVSFLIYIPSVKVRIVLVQWIIIYNRFMLRKCRDADRVRTWPLRRDWDFDFSPKLHLQDQQSKSLSMSSPQYKTLARYAFVICFQLIQNVAQDKRSMIVGIKKFLYHLGRSISQC